MNIEQENDYLKKLSKSETFSRDELLFILTRLSVKVGIESFSRVLDVQEELGFTREESSKF